MADITKIHQDKTPVRRHYLGEWLEARGMTVSDLLKALNDDERSMELPRIDKSQPYRWLKGQLPHASTQQRIADALGLDDPADLLRPPEVDWIAKFLEGRSKAERERARQILEMAFPDKTGTDE